MGKSNGKGFFSALVVRLIAFLTIVFVIVIGIGLGLALAETSNTKNQENFVELAPALPTKIMDVNGTLITEFASDEKRELVTISELPRHLVHAVLSREDPDFYNHRGFSVRGIARAAMGVVTGVNLGGGSTITQQVAGTLYTNRSERSIKRKVKELWWAFQIERRYTKNEILEIYLNYMPMGPGTYGVETASKYFFGHSSREVDLAESAVLAVLLSGPTRFDPLRNPTLAMDRQHKVLERMIEFGYADKDEAEVSYAKYWENFDWTRPSLSAYLTREDKAPWFSEYVRRELDGLMYGSMDYYRDGFVVHTTLNLEYQESAERFMAEGLERANKFYAAQGRTTGMERQIQPLLNMIGLALNVTDLRTIGYGQNEIRANSRYNRIINPVVDMAALALGVSDLREITNHGWAKMDKNVQQNVVEGALVAIENETGYIVAIVGGSKYDESNQYIRASQASVQTGSAFKPLYYSAAIDSRKFTAASMIYDMPVVYFNEDNTPYIPDNYDGGWKGSVLLYNALSLSLNIPSLSILESIGFNAAIDRASALLGYSDEATIRRLFPRVYPLALGVTATSPLRMARAFAVFANQGRDVTPIAIRTVEDRNGKIVFDVERDIRQRQQRAGAKNQVITPQNAYVMTRIMEFATTGGTLAGGAGYGRFMFTDKDGKTFRMPVAGKTGTTQNWSDAWAVGYTPYYTTAVWYGFDMPGNSLGMHQTGASLAAPAWGDLMRVLHMGLPLKNFQRPSGVYDATVCRRSGQPMTQHCNEGGVTLPFLAGTGPGPYCTIHGSSSPYQPKIQVSTGYSMDDSLLEALRPMPTLSPEMMELLAPQTRRSQPQPANTEQEISHSSNPFLDEDFSSLPEKNDNPPAQQPPNTSEDLPSWNPIDD